MINKELLEKIDEYIKFYKKETESILRDFGYTASPEKINEMLKKKEAEIINNILNGVDVSRGLLPCVMQVDDIVFIKDEWFYKIKTKSKNNLLKIVF